MNYEKQIYSGKKASFYGRLGGGIVATLGPIVERGLSGMGRFRSNNNVNWQKKQSL